MWFAADRWFWFNALPPRASPRWCGNCFLGAVGIPTEVGLLGALLVVGSIAMIHTRRDICSWIAAILGIALTNAGIGVVLFTAAYGALVTSRLKTLYQAYFRASTID